MNVWPSMFYTCSPSQPCVLLVIDDDSDQLEIVSRVINSHGLGAFRVLVANSLEEGETRLAQCRVDLILLDLNLFDTHGLETLEKMRSLAPNTPIIVMTGVDDEATAREALEKGAQQYLMKGDVSGRAMVMIIIYVLANFRRLREVQELYTDLKAGLEKVRTKATEPDSAVSELYGVAERLEGYAARLAHS